MKILVTGAAGFIGAAVCKKLASYKDNVVWGLDNINDYYDTALKYGRLSQLGIEKHEVAWNHPSKSVTYPNLYFIKLNLQDNEKIQVLFEQQKFDLVIHLAAQAGVRYSIDHPHEYIKSNIDGFINILEGCRHNKVKHLVYASSSSVYGLNDKVPFSEHDSTEHPVSLYAATKKSNEMMAHAYAHLYNLPVTGLRFFTVYGPWGRPDMSPFLFIDAIANDKPIKVFNNGNMMRDFTFIEDIVESIVKITYIIPKRNDGWDAKLSDPSTSKAPYRIYNIGNSKPVRLLDYIKIIETVLGKEAKKVMMPMQPGDVYQTHSDSSDLESAIGFKPSTPLETGIGKTVQWYLEYFNINNS